MTGRKNASGRKRIPTEIKKANGTHRPNRDREPIKISMMFTGEKPPGLHQKASDEWDRLVIICRRAGVLTDADWIAWSLGFRSYSVVLHCMDYLEDRSLEEWSTESESGYRQAGPELTILKQNWTQTLQFCREFGLTASSRSGLDIDNGSSVDDDPIAKYLN